MKELIAMIFIFGAIITTDIKADTYINSLGTVIGYESNGRVYDSDSNLYGFLVQHKIVEVKTGKPLFCISVTGNIHDYIDDYKLGPKVGEVK